MVGCGPAEQGGTDPKCIKLFKEWDDDVISEDYRWEAICLGKGDVLCVRDDGSKSLTDWTDTDF